MWNKLYCQQINKSSLDTCAVSMKIENDKEKYTSLYGNNRFFFISKKYCYVRTYCIFNGREFISMETDNFTSLASSNLCISRASEIGEILKITEKRDFLLDSPHSRISFHLHHNRTRTAFMFPECRFG